MSDAKTSGSIPRELHFVSWLVNSDLNENHSDSTNDDIDESGLKECECDPPVSDWDSCLLDPEEQYHLPKSSPVISRKRLNIELETEKQSSPTGMSLTPPVHNRLELSTSPSTTVNNNSNLHTLEQLNNSDKREELSVVPNKASVSVPDINKDASSLPGCLDHCNLPMGSIGQTKFHTYHCGTGFISPFSQESQLPSHSTGRLSFESVSRRLRVSQNKGLQPGPKRRAFSDITSVSGQRSSGQAKKCGSFVDVHSTEDLYRSSLDLDQENAHFVVVDMVLEVLETVKWVVCLRQLNCTNPYQDGYKTHNTTKTDSISSFDSRFEDDSTPNRHSLASFESPLQSSRMPCSAEHLAHHLVSEFRKQWFPSEQLHNPDNLTSALQEVSVPMMSGDMISLTEEIRQKSRMRGTLTWAPPRFQIIFCVQPTHRRSDVIASQHFLCAGCGTEVNPRYIKKLQYCDYLGRYFCDGCHGGGESVIPARVLSNWDFARYPVCHFSRQLLDSIWQQPLFKITSLAKNLYNQAKELQRFRELQEQLISIKKLLSTCRLSAGVCAEFEQLPSHVMGELHLFSMDDLIRVKKGQLCITARALMQSATAHIDNCELCQAKGFICEFCHGKEVLFPFQRYTCTCCQDCKACFHISCFRNEACPKCTRLLKRKKLQEATNS
ncbi:protein associated with UVRAG as autophagy enhancer-like isoform X2 [Myxocyprinus asiaticus]|uniref:protein associated with UVRAG as autophagy enhancer-like isoform X2 n=1 Tax=Myxocyprinus asiaticus TaxID=70543 RepID=UPI0022225F16|nr:protein associated with UVRAG as autophagy enhancer-like isoform X2 [Myxocyprinus asiaticus]